MLFFKKKNALLTTGIYIKELVPYHITFIESQLFANKLLFLAN